MPLDITGLYTFSYKKIVNISFEKSINIKKFVLYFGSFKSTLLRSYFFKAMRLIHEMTIYLSVNPSNILL